MTTITDAWVYHIAPWSVAPTLTTLSYFGLTPADNKAQGDAPFNTKILQETTFDSFSPSLTAGSKVANQINLRFVPVNAIWLYWILGKVSGAATKTITTMDGTARKPRIALWQKSDNTIYHHYGVLIYNAELDYLNNGFIVSLMGKGTAHGTDATSPTITFPTSIDTGYHIFTSMSWNANSISPLRFKATYQHAAEGYIDQNGQYYQEINEYSPVLSVYNVQFNSADGETIMADYIAGTKRSFKFRMSKPDATKYIEVTTNAMIASIVGARVYGENITYSAVLVGEGPSGVAVDGVADAMYQL